MFMKIGTSGWGEGGGGGVYDGTSGWCCYVMYNVCVAPVGVAGCWDLSGHSVCT